MKLPTGNKKIASMIFLFVILLSGINYATMQKILNLNAYAHQDCNLPANVCPFNQTVPTESAIGFVVIALLGLYGIYIYLQKPPSGKGMAILSQKVKKEKMKMLSSQEKKLYNIIIDNQGTMFQGELVDKSGLSKVKVTRILDKLEGKGIVERKRRGMSNVVVLKH